MPRQRAVIASEASRHREQRDSPRLLPEQLARLGRLLREDDDPALFTGALRDLSALLATHHGERVVILIDEVDEVDVPILHAWTRAGFDEAVSFFKLPVRRLEGQHLFKTVLTGVLRIANESLLSAQPPRPLLPDTGPAGRGRPPLPGPLCKHPGDRSVRRGRMTMPAPATDAFTGSATLQPSPQGGKENICALLSLRALTTPLATATVLLAANGDQTWMPPRQH